MCINLPPVVMQSLTFQKGSEQPVQVDSPYVRCQAKLAHLAANWISLEHVSPQSGPLAYYPGSHRVEISGFFDWGVGGNPCHIRLRCEIVDLRAQGNWLIAWKNSSS